MGVSGAGSRGRKGTRALRRVLNGPFGHSGLERAFPRLVRRSGLPLPRTQVTFRTDRVVRVDAFWDRERGVPGVLGHRWHSTRRDAQRDAHRRNELQELGLLVLEFTGDDIGRRPRNVVGRLSRTLAKRRPAPVTPPAGSGDAFRSAATETVARTG